MHKTKLIALPLVAVSAAAAMSCSGGGEQSEPTRASQSEYNQDIMKATTSTGLTNADIAWHAVNTYGWDCEEVVSQEKSAREYFMVTCSSGTKLRVYPRAGKHPRITN
jgi:hypothetical protein